MFHFPLDLRDSSGIRFYLANELRKYDLGYVLFGTLSSPASLAIPPKAEQFIVDSYCPPEATRVCTLLHSNEISDYSRVVLYPIEFSKFRYQCCVRLATYPLTRYMICMKNHISRSVGGRMGADFCPIYFNTPFRSLFTKNYNPLVSKIGYSVWTKLIRNNTAVQYLFNADAFNFNYQFANRLPKPIKIYPVRNKTANIHQILSIFRETHLLLAVYTIHKTRMRSHW